MIRRLSVYGAILALVPGVCVAETLNDAIALAYQTNPALRAQRAALRSVNEGYVQAKAGYGPQVNITAQVGYQDARVNQAASVFSRAHTTDFRSETGSTDLSAVQPLYTGGAVRAQVAAANANILAGRQELRQAESQLLQNVITAYVDVRRDRETIRILKDEIVVLKREFDEIKAKGALGALTRTDVAQSESRLLAAEAQLNLALGHLNASNAEYLNAVGQSPGELEPEPDLPGLPATVDQAFDAADHNNPQVLAAIEAERAAREKVNQAKAANAPTVSVRIDAAVTPNLPYVEHQYDKSVTVAAVVTKPLFTSGLNSSRIREALEDDNRAELNIESTRRNVVQTVSQAWDQLVFTRGALAIEQRQVSVESVAVEGNRVEERVGLRTTIDLLNAELELANSRLNLLQSHHDQYVAQAILLSAMGLLEARYLDPATPVYRPEEALKKVQTNLVAPLEAPGMLIDRVAAPSTREPRLSSPMAGATRPDGSPALPAQP